MSLRFNQTSRRLGIISAAVTVIVLTAYAVTLAIGFASLSSPDEPIGDPMFSILEVLIIMIMPAAVTLMVSIHAWSPVHLKTLSFTAVIFMALVAVVTSCLHFVILTISRHDAFVHQEWLQLFLSFQWPSVAYALDILAWDIFFPLSMFFASMVFRGNRLNNWIRRTMILSGTLAVAGLSGVMLGDMQYRNIGIIGYVGVFFIVVVLVGILFYRTETGKT
jgi:hypothetical protein